MKEALSTLKWLVIWLMVVAAISLLLAGPPPIESPLLAIGCWLGPVPVLLALAYLMVKADLRKENAGQ